MGFISFKKFCLIVFGILLTCYYISAFRLIHTHTQTHESKTKADLKESVKKIIEEKENVISYKDKYRNQTMKLQYEEKISEDEEKMKTRIISEKKLKPVQPTLPEITKEKILRAKPTKTDEKENKPSTDKTKLVIPVKEESKDEISKKIINKKEVKPKVEKIEIQQTKEEKVVAKKPKEEKLEAKKEKDKVEQEKIVTKKPKEEKLETKKEKDKVEQEKVVTKKPKEEKLEGKKEKDKVEQEKVIVKKPKDKVEQNKVKEKKIEAKKITVTKKVEIPKKKDEKKTGKSENKIEVKSKSQTSFFNKNNFDSSITSLYFNLPSFSPNFEVVENEECRKQGHILIDQLNKRKLWALKMFDATAKVPSGILKGNLNQLGDYDQCTSIFTKIQNEDKPESDIKIAGKYCLANINIEAKIPEMKLSVHLAQSRSMIRSKIQDPGHFIPRFTIIRWGLCIPSGCSALDAEKILEDSIKTYNESSYIGIDFDVSVDSDECYVRKASKSILDYNYETLATLGLTGLIIVFVIIATIRDIRLTETSEEVVCVKKQENGIMENIIMAFSLKRTSASLLQSESNSDEIECIHGIRTICTFMLYIAHKLIPIGHMPFVNKTTLTEISNNPFSIILRLSVIYTDSFLLLSGILTSYGMSKDIEDKGHIPWFNRIVARFIRLTPSLFFILLYYAYVLEFLGDGPLWNTVIVSNAKLCKESWWKNILYIQNIYSFQEMCATHTHQLALDMQLFLIAPILVWLLYKRPLLGVFITIFLHCVSIVLRYYTTINYRLSLVIYHGISMNQLYRTANMLYASSIHRATPYITGVGLGVLLRQIKSNFSVPKILSVPGWIIAGFFAFWALYSPSHLSSKTYQYDINEAAQFAAFCSLAWALALSWLILYCFLNKEGILNLFLSSHLMIVLSKISYTLYLTQFIVFFYNVGSKRSPTEFKISSSVDIFELVIILTLSTLLTLLVDMPIQKIKSNLFKRSTTVEESEVSSENENIETNMEKSLENVELDTIDDDKEADNENENVVEDLEDILEEDEEIVRKLENNILNRKRKMEQSLSTDDDK